MANFVPNDHQRRQRKPMTPEQRASWNAYLRRYRAAHPERVKAWREAQTLRAAERILHAREAAAAAAQADGLNGSEVGVCDR